MELTGISAYWQREAARMPNRIFAVEAGHSADWFEAEFESTRTAPLLHLAARRCDTSTALVHSAMLHALLAGVSRAPATLLYNGERMIPTTVGVTAETTIDTVVAITKANTVRTQDLPQIDHRELREIMAIEERRRGIMITGWSTDFQTNPGLNVFHGVDDESLRAIAAQGTSRWNSPPSSRDALTGPFAIDARLTTRIAGGQTTVRVAFNRSNVGAKLIAALVEGIDPLLQAWLDGDTSIADIPHIVNFEQSTSNDILRVGVDIASPRLIDKIVLAHPDVIEARTEISNAGSLHAQLWCYYTTRCPDATSGAQLREHFLSMIEPGAAVVCPARFIGTIAPYLREGKTPRSATTRPHPRAIEYLLAVVRESTGAERIDASLSYIEVGGRLEHVPAVHRAMNVAGWYGVEPADFTRPISMASLAGLLWSYKRGPKGGVS